jgi:hypothetical protein
MSNKNPLVKKTSSSKKTPSTKKNTLDNKLSSIKNNVIEVVIDDSVDVDKIVNDFIKTYSLIIELQDQMRASIEKNLKIAKDENYIKILKRASEKLDESDNNVRVLVTNPNSDEYTKRSIDELKKLEGDNIIKMPGLIIIK